MEQKETKKRSSFMQNVLILMFAQIMVKVLGLVYKFVITNFEGFGDTGLGYYSAGYQIYSLLLALSSIGIPSVVSKLVSERIAKGDNKGAQRIFKICMAFFVGIGIVLSFGLFFGAEYIAIAMYDVADTKYVMQVLAPAIAFVSASAVFRGYFAGLNDMKPTSYSQIIEQFFNCVLSITFVYALLGREPYIMAAGGNLSTTLAIILTFVYLIIYYKRKKIKIEPNQKSEEDELTAMKLLKKILIISVPVTISSIISVVSPLIDTATVSRCIQTAFANMYPVKEQLEALAMSKNGILSKVDTLVNLPIAVNVAFSTALVPAISGAIAQKDMKTASKRMTFSIFASLLIVLPCAVGFISLAQPILSLIYPTASDGAEVLMVYAIAMIFIALNQTVNGGLYGLNKTYIPAISLIIGIIIKFVLNIVLISNPKIEIMGAGISTVICQLVAFLICIVALQKNIKLHFKCGRMIIAPIIASVIMGVSTYLINQALNNIVRMSISTILSIIFGALIYIVLIFALKILRKEDFMMIPFGSKIYSVLIKLKIYKEEN
jgi:stage V sporulation protein B